MVFFIPVLYTHNSSRVCKSVSPYDATRSRFAFSPAHPHDVDGSDLVPAIHQIPVSRVEVKFEVEVPEVEPPTVEHVIFIFRTQSGAVWRSLARKENPSCDHVCYVMSYVKVYLGTEYGVALRELRVAIILVNPKYGANLK